MFDAYSLYAKWCLDMGRKPPSRAWWDAHSNKRTCEYFAKGLSVPHRKWFKFNSDQQFDHDIEHREGWTHDH